MMISKFKKFSFLFYFIIVFCGLGRTSLAAIVLDSRREGGNFIYDYDPKALSSNVILVFRNGSLGDPKGKEGLSRLALNSLLRGTKNKSRLEFVSAVERLGAAVEVDPGVNRSILILNAISDKLEPAIQLVAEAVLSPALRDEEINALKGEELARLNQNRSNNREHMKRIVLQALYHGTALAFPPQGTIEGVQRVGLEDIRASLAAAIKSDNILFAVTSNRSEQEVKTWLEKAFAAVPEGGRPPEPKINAQAPKGRVVYLMNRPGSSTTEFAIAQPGIKSDDVDREALETGMFIFGADFTSRVNTVLRKQNGWTYGATASYELIDLPRRHGGTFLLYSFPQAEFTEKLVPRAVQLFEDYARKGITGEELKYAQNSLSNSYAFRFAESKIRVLERVYHELDHAPLLSVAEYRKKIRSLTSQKILQAIRRVHDPKDIILVLVGDPMHTKDIAKLVPGIVKTVTVEDPMKEF